MGLLGDAHDNAMSESFFGTLERERLARNRFNTPVEARGAVFGFIESFNNPRHRHSLHGDPSAEPRTPQAVCRDRRSCADVRRRSLCLLAFAVGIGACIERVLEHGDDIAIGDGSHSKATSFLPSEGRGKWI